MANFIVTMGGSEQGQNRHNTSYGIHRDYTAEALRLFDSAPHNYAKILSTNTSVKHNQYCGYEEAQKVLEQPSMGWAFKSIAIRQALNQMEDNDFLLWCDSNHVIVGDLGIIKNLAQQNNIFCHDHTPTKYSNSQWTKRDTFIAMECDSERYWRSLQMQVNVMGFVKNKFVEKFVDEWLLYCLKYDVIIGNNVHANLPDFIEHRHEQSIFSILIEKYRIPYSAMPQGIIHEKQGIDTHE